MFEEADKTFDQILKTVHQNDIPEEIIVKAYEKAKELHKEQKRKDGQPYINHPVAVALILAKLEFDENVIAGGLLHDTIEDCGYTKTQMISDFNETVFELVDCVSAIDDAKYIFDKKDIFEDPNFVKSSAEEQTFKKLISLGKNNPCGFAIKFADRLHNLRTIETFDYNKQLEKVRETEKWVLPIAKALRAEYFYRAITNECFKIVNRQKGRQFFESYNAYHSSNTSNILRFETRLKELFAGSLIKDIRIKNVREYKVFQDLSKIYKNIDIREVSQGQILKVTNYNIYMLFNDGISIKEATAEVLKFLNKQSDLKIIDANIGSFSNKVYYQINDSIKNKYNVYILSKNEYRILKVGTLNGQNLDLIDEENINSLDEDLIKVRTRSGEIKYIMKNSTALDLAFKLHRDIGFAFKYAIINDSKSKLPPYTKLNENDRVEIITDMDENGEMKNNAKLNWLAYVNTEHAKKILIKYFSRMIE